MRLRTAGSHAADDTETQGPCETPSLMFDVKATESNLPLLFDFPGMSDCTKDRCGCYNHG